jgi:hypothetical protein
MAWMIREDQLDPDQREFINVESKKSGQYLGKRICRKWQISFTYSFLKDMYCQRTKCKNCGCCLYTFS